MRWLVKKIGVIVEIESRELARLERWQHRKDSWEMDRRE